jgi:exoribonuclease-2
LCRKSLNTLGYNPSMNVLFEEDGGFKAGSIMADNDSSLQVEMPTGKRCKIKAATVLLRFEKPSAAALLDQATPLAEEIEAEFLWECVSDGEFSFLDFARDYYGHEPTSKRRRCCLPCTPRPSISTAKARAASARRLPTFSQLLWPVLKRASASAHDGRLDWRAEAFRLPPEIGAMTDALLYAPDRNKPETKAFETACADVRPDGSADALQVRGDQVALLPALPSFPARAVPQGRRFSSAGGAEAAERPAARRRAPSRSTTPTPPKSTMRCRSSNCPVSARASASTSPRRAWPSNTARRSTALRAPGCPRSYMPGNKITMLPDAVVQNYTLAGGVDCPAVSLYLTVNESLEILSHESRLEMVHIAANLRHHEIEPWFNAETINGPLPDQPFKDELVHLWHFANACEGRRQALGDAGHQRLQLRDRRRSGRSGCLHREISERKRGSPLDKLVAELMIVANSTWGGLLAEKNIACLYRAQTQGKVRMTTSPLPHEGLGVPQYAWMTSPLRRYCDMVNQWQLIACLKGETPAFAQKSAELFGAMRDFELTYAAYADFQRQMERYWCLRWLQQQGDRNRGHRPPRAERQARPSAAVAARAVAATDLWPGSGCIWPLKPRSAGAGSELPIHQPVRRRQSAEAVEEDEA